MFKRPWFSRGERLNDYERDLLDNVDRHGWYCTAVYGDEAGPGFAYSVGFTTSLAAPEFIIFGLDLKLMHSMLWDCVSSVEGW